MIVLAARWVWFSNRVIASANFGSAMNRNIHPTNPAKMLVCLTFAAIFILLRTSALGVIDFVFLALPTTRLRKDC
jgi:hypothetical protein